MDFKIESPENQQKFVVPLNRDTEKIFYNQRFILDNKVLSEPLAWRVTKINRIAHNGLCLVTLAQNKFDQHKDYIELDERGNIIAQWADYYSSVEPIEPVDHNSVYSKITFSGLNSEIKIGGSYKKFTVKFYDGDIETQIHPGTWSYTIDDVDASSVISTSTTSVDANQIKIKFTGGDNYIGKTLRINYTSTDDIVSFVDVLITTL